MKLRVCWNTQSTGQSVRLSGGGGNWLLGSVHSNTTTISTLLQFLDHFRSKLRDGIVGDKFGFVFCVHTSVPLSGKRFR